MMKFQWGNLTSATNVTALGAGTLRFILKSPSAFSGQIFWFALGVGTAEADWQLYFTGTTIAFQTSAANTEDPDIYTIPASVSTWYDFAINYNFGTTSVNTPVMYLNGVKQTVTRASTSTGLKIMADTPWILGYTTDSEAAGGMYVGGFAWWSSQLSDANMEKLTRAKIHNMPLYISPSTLVQYTPLDDIPVGEYTGQGTNIVPNADVTNTFVSGNYASIAADDATYLKIDKNDDSETCTYALGTFTIPSGFSGYAVTHLVQGWYDDNTVNKLAGTYLNKGGGGTTTSWIPDLTSVESAVSRSEYTALSQTDVDGMQTVIVSPAMSKNGDIYLELVQIKVSYRRHALTNLKGTIEFKNVATTVLSVGLSGSGFGY